MNIFKIIAFLDIFKITIFLDGIVNKFFLFCAFLKIFYSNDQRGKNKQTI